MNDNEKIDRNILYKDFLEERNSILEHKWYMSERAGYDVGFEKALLDWCLNHRENFHKKRANDRAALLEKEVAEKLKQDEAWRSSEFMFLKPKQI